jgi:hypothetical protein
MMYHSVDSQIFCYAESCFFYSYRISRTPTKAQPPLTGTFYVFTAMSSHHLSRDCSTQGSTATSRTASPGSGIPNTTSSEEWGQHEDAVLYYIGKNVVEKEYQTWDEVGMRQVEIFPGYEIPSLEMTYQSLREERDRLSIARSLQSRRMQMKVDKLFPDMTGTGSHDTWTGHHYGNSERSRGHRGSRGSYGSRNRQV